MPQTRRSKRQSVHPAAQRSLLRSLDRHIHHRLQRFVTSDAQVLCKLAWVSTQFNNHVMSNLGLWGVVFFSKLAACKSKRPSGLKRALSLAAQCGNVQAKLIAGHDGYRHPIFCNTDTFCHASAQIGRTIFVTGGAMVSKKSFNKDLLKFEIVKQGSKTVKTTLRHKGMLNQTLILMQHQNTNTEQVFLHASSTCARPLKTRVAPTNFS